MTADTIPGRGRGGGRGAYYKARYGGGGRGRGGRGQSHVDDSQSDGAGSQASRSGPRNWNELQSTLQQIDGNQYGKSGRLTTLQP